MSAAHARLSALVSALNSTCWSSWQSTARFSSQLDAARAELAAERVREAAPDLLDIAQRTAALLAAQRFRVDGPGVENALRRDALAAIAKATGEAL